jgi:hypothetical protein
VLDPCAQAGVAQLPEDGVAVRYRLLVAGGEGEGAEEVALVELAGLSAMDTARPFVHEVLEEEVARRSNRGRKVAWSAPDGRTGEDGAQGGAAGSEGEGERVGELAVPDPDARFGEEEIRDGGHGSALGPG